MNAWQSFFNRKGKAIFSEQLINHDPDRCRDDSVDRTFVRKESISSENNTPFLNNRIVEQKAVCSVGTSGG